MNEGLENDYINWSGAIEHAQLVSERSGMETCGYVVDSRVIICINHSDIRGRFALSVDDCVAVYAAMERGTLNGVWHSHPDGTRYPSSHDWDGHPQGATMFIIALTSLGATILQFGEEGNGAH